MGISLPTSHRSMTTETLGGSPVTAIPPKQDTVCAACHGDLTRDDQFCASCGTPRRHGLRRSWIRRHPVTSAFLVIIVAMFVGFGVVLSRAATTVNTLQSVSTPPPVVSLLPEDTVTSVAPPVTAAALAPASDVPVQTVVQLAPPAAVMTDQLVQPVQ